MLKTAYLSKVIELNKTLEHVLVALDLPFVRMYIGSERPYEVQLGRGRPALLVVLVPLPDNRVRLIIKPNGMMRMTKIQDLEEILLKQTLFRFFKEIA